MSNPSEITVQVVDDDEAVRDSLQLLLEAAGYRARAWSSGPALLRAPAIEPGCIVIDVRMPEMDGVTLLARLRERGIRHPVIIMTGHADVPLAVRAMRAGAIDFIEKPFSDQVILQAVRDALAQGVNGAPASADAAARLATLTPREHEVLRALIAGLPNKSIAYDLGISARTVEIHRARVMEKMHARSLSELVRLGLAAGINPDAE